MPSQALIEIYAQGMKTLIFLLLLFSPHLLSGKSIVSKFNESRFHYSHKMCLYQSDLALIGGRQAQ